MLCARYQRAGVRTPDELPARRRPRASPGGPGWPKASARASPDVAEQALVDRPPPRASRPRRVDRVEQSSPQLPPHERRRGPAGRADSRDPRPGGTRYWLRIRASRPSGSSRDGRRRWRLRPSRADCRVTSRLFQSGPRPRMPRRIAPSQETVRVEYFERRNTNDLSHPSTILPEEATSTLLGVCAPAIPVATPGAWRGGALSVSNALLVRLVSVTTGPFHVDGTTTEPCQPLAKLDAAELEGLYALLLAGTEASDGRISQPVVHPHEPAHRRRDLPPRIHPGGDRRPRPAPSKARNGGLPARRGKRPRFAPSLPSSAV